MDIHEIIKKYSSDIKNNYLRLNMFYYVDVESKFDNFNVRLGENNYIMQEGIKYFQYFRYNVLK